MAQALKTKASEVDIRVDPNGVVDRFPGPACIVDAERFPLISNAHWQNLGLASPGDDACLPAEFAASLLALSHTAQPQRLAYDIPGAGEGDGLSFDFMLLPCTMDGAAASMLLGFDRTATELVQNALAKDREFHRSLALCSGDAVFELDQSGRFTYVGPNGFLGYADFELHGREIRKLVSEQSAHASELIFTSHQSVSGSEIWFFSQSGEARCFILSMVPYCGSDGEWAGLRCISREVTGQRILEVEIRDTRNSQQRIEAVLHAMRTEARPSTMIAAGTSTLLESIDISACIVVHADENGFDRIEAYAEVGGDMSLPVAPSMDNPHLLDLCSHICRQSEGGLCTGEIDGFSVMISPTRYGGQINGEVGLLRGAANLGGAQDEVWGESDRHLLRAVAGQMGVAIAQLYMFERPLDGKS
ncbi:MAG: PAS domain S-box protein [Rhizobiales bacterium]|nr:PAS domain S-box protein [Hyphomicrobiales bacterium]